MEIELSPPMIAKKLWKVVRIVLYMLRKGLSKSKIMLDLKMMLKGGKIASKAIRNLMLNHHYFNFSCRSNDVGMSFISPREYEFSCSNSPAASFALDHSKRRNHHHRCRYNGDLDMFYSQETVVEAASPLALPGFGKSPMVRQLRVTDSPFPLKDSEEDIAQVNKAADEFIKKFYKELKKQRFASLDYLSPNHIWAR